MSLTGSSLHHPPHTTEQHWLRHFPLVTTKTRIRITTVPGSPSQRIASRKHSISFFSCFYYFRRPGLGHLSSPSHVPERVGGAIGRHTPILIRIPVFLQRVSIAERFIDRIASSEVHREIFCTVEQPPGNSGSALRFISRDAHHDENATVSEVAHSIIKWLRMQSRTTSVRNLASLSSLSISQDTLREG